MKSERTIITKAKALEATGGNSSQQLEVRRSRRTGKPNETGLFRVMCTQKHAKTGKERDRQVCGWAFLASFWPCLFSLFSLFFFSEFYRLLLARSGTASLLSLLFFFFLLSLVMLNWCIRLATPAMACDWAATYTKKQRLTAR